MSLLSGSVQWHWGNVSLNEVGGMRTVCTFLYDKYLSFSLYVCQECVSLCECWDFACVCVCPCKRKVVKTRLHLDRDPEVTGQEFRNLIIPTILPLL